MSRNPTEDPDELSLDSDSHEDITLDQPEPINEPSSEKLPYPDNLILAPSALCGIPLPLNLGTLNICLAGLSFLCLFTSFTTIQNLQAPLNDKWGVWCLSLLYITYAFANLFAPVVVSRVGPKIAVFLGSIGYSSFIVANSIYAWSGQTQAWLLFVGSFLNGLGASLIWSGQGSFLGRWSVSSNLGRNSGMFFGIFQVNGVIGNLVLATILGKSESAALSNVNTLMIVLTVATLLANMFFLVLGDPPVPVSDQAAPQLPPVEFFKTNMLSTWRFLRETDILKTIGPFIAFGAISGIQNSIMTKWAGAQDSDFKDVDKSTVGWVMVVYSICLVISSAACGKLGDIYGSEKNIMGGLLFGLASLSMAFITPEQIKANEWFFVPYIALALLGCGNGFTTTGIYAILGRYKEFTLPSYPFFNFTQSTIASMFLFTAPWLKNYQIPVGAAAAIVAFALITYMLIRFTAWKREKDGFAAINLEVEDDESSVGGEMNLQQVSSNNKQSESESEISSTNSDPEN